MYVTLEEPLWSTTVELTVNYIADAERLNDDAWFLTVFTTPAAQMGFYREEGEVWTDGGQLLARSSQLALFRPAHEVPLRRGAPRVRA